MQLEKNELIKFAEDRDATGRMLHTDVPMEEPLGEVFEAAFGLAMESGSPRQLMILDFDMGDIAEAYQQAADRLRVGVHCPVIQARFEERIHILPESSCTGEEFLSRLEVYFKKHRPGLVWLVPASVYFGAIPGRRFLNEVQKMAEENAANVVCAGYLGDPKWQKLKGPRSILVGSSRVVTIEDLCSYRKE